MTGCTVSGNTGDSLGGGLMNCGKATLTNCTVSGNTANGRGGGLYVVGTATLTLTNSTVSGNTAISGGGLYVFGGTVRPTNTLVAGNAATGSSSTPPNTAPDSYGPVASQGSNLVSKTDGGSGWVAADQTGTVAAPLDPRLGPLADNGGPTKTHALLADSPAVDAGPATAPGTQDQRGLVRDALADIGAFELGARLSQAITFAPLAPVTFGVAPITLAATSSSGLAVTYTVVSGPGTLSGNTLTVTGGGSIVVQADQPGDFNFFPAPAVQQTLTVSLPALVVCTTTDVSDGNYTPGQFSLREAVALANSNPGPDTITFDPMVFGTPQTITLDNGQLLLSDTTGATAIIGPAAGVTLRGGGTDRVLQVNTDVIATLSKLSLTGGRGAGSAYGGGLLNYGTATLTDCTIAGNSLTDSVGAGLASYGTLTLTNCLVRGNSITTSGSTTFNSGGGLAVMSGTATLTNTTVSDNTLDGVVVTRQGSGVRIDAGTVTLTNCTVSGNTGATQGGGLINQGTATLTNCTVSGNNATLTGGGLVNVSGAVLTLTNCTVSGNTSGGNGGGLHYNAGTGVVTLVGCTVSGNTAGTTGGGLNVGTGTVRLTNTIVAGNVATGTGPDTNGPVASQGYNLIGKTNGGIG